MKFSYTQCHIVAHMADTKPARPKDKTPMRIPTYAGKTKIKGKGRAASHVIDSHSWERRCCNWERGRQNKLAE